MADMTIRIVVAGSRDIFDYKLIMNYIDEFIKLNNIDKKSIQIISGGSKGVDTIAKNYAIINNIQYIEFKPQYKYQNDMSAPLRRNTEMAKYGHVLIAFWNGFSRGTKHMISEMEKLNKQVIIYKI
jgi:hypothetical protein